jgi:hypothetical protein
VPGVYAWSPGFLFVFIQKKHEKLQKIFQYFFKKISKPLPLFPPILLVLLVNDSENSRSTGLRLKKTQAKPAHQSDYGYCSLNSVLFDSGSYYIVLYRIIPNSIRYNMAGYLE